MARKYKKKRIPSRLKSQVVLRDKGICQICGEQGSIVDLGWEIKAYQYIGHPYQICFEIDHIIPESKGGQTILDNLQLLCRHCNRSKGAKEIIKNE